MNAYPSNIPSSFRERFTEEKRTFTTLLLCVVPCTPRNNSIFVTDKNNDGPNIYAFYKALNYKSEHIVHLIRVAADFFEKVASFNCNKHCPLEIFEVLCDVYTDIANNETKSDCMNWEDKSAPYFEKVFFELDLLVEEYLNIYKLKCNN